jgi:hypothetical protein
MVREVKSHGERAIALLLMHRAITPGVSSYQQAMGEWYEQRNALLAEVDRAKRLEDADREVVEAVKAHADATQRMHQAVDRRNAISREPARHS